MPHDKPPIDTDLLLAQAGWVRSLARSLVRDPVGAEDVAQDTILAALQSPPPHVPDERSMRAWLGRVTYNLTHLSTRRTMRRQAREEEVARHESTGSTADVVERAAGSQMLLDAVNRLDEPYRSTVLLRYFEGLPTDEIARQTGATAVAVRKRLSRAVARLRVLLDESNGGDRRAWFQALVPLAALPPGWIAPGPVELAASSWTLKAMATSPLLHASLAASALGWAVWNGGAGADERLVRVEPEGVATALVAQVHPRDASPIEGALSPTPHAFPSPIAPEDEVASDASPASAELTVRGLVVDPSGRPIPGVALVSEDDPSVVLGHSDARGAFAVSFPAGYGAIVLNSDGWSTLRKSVVGEVNRDDEHLLVAAPAMDLIGRVVDRAGAPIPDARVELHADDGLFVELARPLGTSYGVPRSARTAADGHFLLAGAAAWEGLRVRVVANGYVPADVQLAQPTDGALVCTLRAAGRATADVARELHGRVVHHDGTPAPEALVKLERYATEAGTDGTFTLAFGELEADEPLLAVLPGFQRARLAAPDWTTVDDELVLRLGPAPRSIHGRVLDADGDPCVGWIVTSTEGAAYGETWVRELLERDDRSDLATATVTDAEGAFVLEGLVDGEQVVLAYDPDSLLLVESRPTVPDAGAVELHVPANSLRERLSGRVVSRAGEPIADTRVTVSLAVDTGSEAWREYGAAVQTDEEGRFELADVPRRHVKLEVADHGVVATEHEIAPDAPDDHNEIEVARDRTFRLDAGSLGALGGADELAVLDADGDELALESGDGVPSPRAPIFDGRTPVLRVADSATTLVLYLDGVEVGRSELDLDDTGVTVVRP